MPPRRRRPSTVDRLDPEIKQLIATLRIDKGWGIDEIRDKLEELLEADLVPSRSALGRHTKSLEDVAADMKRSREVADALVAQLGDAPEDKTASLNIELAHSMLFRMFTSVNAEGDGKPVVFGPMEMMLVTKAVQQLASAQKTNTDNILRVRQETAKAAAKAVDQAAKKVAGGLTRDTIDTIKREILGVAT